MRIDDENKVVWCSESEMEWYVSCNYGHPNSLGSDMNRIKSLAIGNHHIVSFMMSGAARFQLVKAIANNYKFELEQPQKYYWRKKKEHLAWFEEQERCYFNSRSGGLKFLSSKEEHDIYFSFITQFTEAEAKELLKDDFNMFEKVEVE